MKVLVTGATGYIGRRLVSEIINRVGQARVLTMNRDVEKARKLLPYERCIHKSARDAEAVREFRPEVVIHLATLSTSDCSERVIEPMLQTNIGYGLWLLHTLSEIKTDFVFVNVGSFAEYRLGVKEGFRPAYLYTATKSAFRQIVQFYKDLCGFYLITAVPYTVYGGADTQKKLIDYLFESIDSAEPVDMTQGEQVLDFIHVNDVVDFFVRIVENPRRLPEGEYHIGTGRGTSIRALADMISNVTGKRLNVNWGGRNYRPLDVMHAIAPKNDELSKFWKPRINLAEALKEMCETK